jgi:hypothetical protein
MFAGVRATNTNFSIATEQPLSVGRVAVNSSNLR